MKTSERANKCVWIAPAKVFFTASAISVVLLPNERTGGPRVSYLVTTAACSAPTHRSPLLRRRCSVDA